MPVTLTLSDGKKAEIREGFGRDLRKAQVMAGKDAGALVPSLVSVLTTVDGQHIVPEDLDNMPLADVFVLQKAISDFFPDAQQP